MLTGTNWSVILFTKRNQFSSGRTHLIRHYQISKKESGPLVVTLFLQMKSTKLKTEIFVLFLDCIRSETEPQAPSLAWMKFTKKPLVSKIFDQKQNNRKCQKIRLKQLKTAMFRVSERSVGNPSCKCCNAKVERPGNTHLHPSQFVTYVLMQLATKSRTLTSNDKQFLREKFVHQMTGCPNYAKWDVSSFMIFNMRSYAHAN